MITQIQGKLVEKYPTHVVIDCHGLGYEVHISLHTFAQLGSEEQVKLFTHLQIGKMPIRFLDLPPLASGLYFVC